MKVKLEFELDIRSKESLEFADNGEQPMTNEMREYLMQSLFEICEDWVLRGKEPYLEFEDV